MARALRFTLLCIALFVIGGVAASAAVHPTVNFAITGDEYAWTVNCTTSTTVPFYQFTVYTMIPQATWNTLAWSQSGPWVGGVDKAWDFTAGSGTGTNVSLVWNCPSGQGVPQYTNWTGVFKVVVPNSAPLLVQDGVKTQGGPYYNKVTTYVPAVPEPSSLAAFGTLLGGLIPLVVRKRK